MRNPNEEALRARDRQFLPVQRWRGGEEEEDTRVCLVVVMVLFV